MRHLLNVFLGVLASAAVVALGDSTPIASAETAAAVVAGGHHTCAVTTAGGLMCWGLNERGQLGDGTSIDRATPVDVSGLTGGVTSVAAGDEHTCAVTTVGGVKCWGQNVSGQLGDDTTTIRTTPADVMGLTSGVAAVTAGRQHTCALTTAGGLKCWGENEHGQLGDGTTTVRTNPADVMGLSSGVAAVAAGARHSCAVTTAGAVKCWGGNDDGELGDGTTTERTTPVDVLGLTSGVISVAAGEDYTCALTTTGDVKCWGVNYHGQVGDGTTTDRITPADVVGLTSGVATVSVGLAHTCAGTTTGRLKCWGWNEHGQLGDGTFVNRATPVDVLGLTDGAISAAAGKDHTCALTTAGSLKCWGSNRSGQLGSGTGWSHDILVDVVGFGAEQLPPGGGIPPTSDARTDGWWAPLWGGVASVVLALATGAWYAKRRRLR